MHGATIKKKVYHIDVLLKSDTLLCIVLQRVAELFFGFGKFQVRDLEIKHTFYVYILQRSFRLQCNYKFKEVKIIIIYYYYIIYYI